MARTRTTKWSSSSAVVALLLATAAGPARAQTEHGQAARTTPSPEDVESGKVAYSEGMALRDKGDEKGALAKFRAAYALVPTPITGLEVGRSLVATGRIIEGRALLFEVAHMPKNPDESEKAGQSRQDAATLADQARAKLASLTVDTDPNATVTVDDGLIPKDALHTPRMLDPGHHVVVVHAVHQSGHAEVDLAPGESQQLHVALHDDATTATATTLRYHPRAPFWISVAATGAGLVIGITTGIAALGVTGHLAGECPNKACPPSAYGDLDTSLALGWVSTIGFAVAGAGAIASVVTFLASGRREAVTTASIRVVPGLGFVSLAGSF